MVYFWIKAPRLVQDHQHPPIVAYANREVMDWAAENCSPLYAGNFPDFKRNGKTGMYLAMSKIDALMFNLRWHGLSLEPSWTFTLPIDTGWYRVYNDENGETHAEMFYACRDPGEWEEHMVARTGIAE